MIIIIQPALPNYRIDLFDRLYSEFGDGIVVYYSPGSLGALTQGIERRWAQKLKTIKNIAGGFLWQSGVVHLKIRKGDIIVLSGNPRYLSTLAFFIKAKFVGAKVVWWGHYWSSSSRRWRFYLRKIPMAMASTLLFYTDQEVERVKLDSNKVKNTQQIFALNNGINVDPIQKLRSSYLAENRENALLFVGRLTIKANLILGLKALARLGENAPTLHIVGDGEEKDHLYAVADALGIKEHVVWHGALTNEKEIAAIANRCKAFLYPGEVGLSLIHAMAYGLPSIVHDRPEKHMPEIAAFENNATGVSFQYDDETSLSEVISNCISNTNLDDWSMTSIYTVDNSFNTKQMAVRFTSLIHKLEVTEI